MAKKKAESRTQKADGGTQSHGDALQTAESEARTYEVGTWAGLPQWRCSLCGFDTLDEQAMLEHAEAHRLQAQNPPPSPTPDPSPNSENLGRGELEEVFEVELKEIDSTFDEQGNEHKTFTIKE
ncbi:MAG: hypothetical protein ACOYZ6_08125 [Chloroflexota bacterium]